MAIILVQIMPLFTIFTFRDPKLAAILLVIKMTILSTFYRYKLHELVDIAISKEELKEMLTNELVTGSMMIPPTFVLFYSFYLGYTRHVEDAIRFTKELETSKRIIAQKELLVLSLSHEVRNPLTSILSNVEFAYEESQESHLKNLLRKAKISGDVLLHLINNFIDTGKIDSENLEVCVTECNVKSFIKSNWMTFEELIKSKALHPKLIIDGNLPKVVRIDHNRVAQILYNLISNAIKFTERGTITLRVSFDEGITEIDNSETLPVVPDEDVNLCKVKPRRTRTRGGSIESSEELPLTSSADTNTRIEELMIEIWKIFLDI